MSQSSIEFVNLFVRSPGDLIYFLIVIAVSQAAFFMALGQRLRRAFDRSAQRYVLAGAGVVATWVFLMVGALAALLTGQDPASVLPPLERAVTVSTILLIGWAFLTADHTAWPRISNLVLLILLAVVIAAYMLTGIQWPAVVDESGFNQSAFGLAWAVIPTVLALLGMVLTLAYFRLVADAPLKLLYFAVLVIGFGYTLLEMANGALLGDYAGPARIAYLAALPIFPAVVYRLVIGRYEAEVVAAPAAATAPPTPPTFEAPAPISPAARERESAQLMRALGIILEGATPGNIPERIIQASLQVLQADVGVLLLVQDANYAEIDAGHDRVMARAISGLAINLDSQPTLVNAIERRTQRPLYADRNVDELRDLYTRFEIEQIGPTYFQPLTKDRELLAVLVVGLPYAGRELDDAAQELLKGIGIISANLLALGRSAETERAQAAGHRSPAASETDDPAVQAAWQQLQASLEAARDKIIELNGEVTTLKVELDFERARAANDLGDTAEGLSISQQLVSLTEEEQQLSEERDRLSARLREAETALAGATAADNEDVFKTIVEVLQREIDELTERRGRLEAQVSELRAVRQLSPVDFVREMMAHMGEEKARLEVERDQLGDQVLDIEAQLRTLGIEGGLTGLAQLVAQLFEQRSGLMARADALQNERDTLVAERQWLETSIANEEARDKQLFVLQTELKHIAEDREAIARLHDRLKVERDDLLEKQDSLKEQRARLTAQVSAFEEELEEAQSNELAMRQQISELNSQRSELMSQRDRLQAEWQALTIERDQLLARADGDRERVQQVGAEGVGSMSRLVGDVSLQRDQLDRELIATRSQLAALEERLEAMRALGAAQGDLVARIENADVLSGMVQELGTPLTSIMNYVDLLLSESAGILGEMQRNFLQRVRANGQRLAAMLDDLVRVSALDSGQFALTTQSVDVIAAIEDAITIAAVQLQERGLTLHLNLDDDAPPLQADPDAIDQIIGQLLTNAYLASPPGSELFVTARRQRVRFGENGSGREVESLYFSFEDRGGGIAPEDLPRVFSRKYKAENPLIRGLGDTGVGMSIARALVEAHGGRLWLETFEQVGSAFNVALPLEPLMQPEGH